MKKKVKMQLVGLDSNAYAVMGAFRKNARKQGWTPEEIKVVIDEAMSGDYDHLLATIMDNVDMSDDDAAEQLRRDEKHGFYGGREDDAN